MNWRDKTDRNVLLSHFRDISACSHIFLTSKLRGLRPKARSKSSYKHTIRLAFRAEVVIRAYATATIASWARSWSTKLVPTARSGPASSHSTPDSNRLGMASRGTTSSMSANSHPEIGGATRRLKARRVRRRRGCGWTRGTGVAVAVAAD